MFKRILIPLDGSELATYAIKPALRVALTEQSECILLRVVEPPPVIMDDTATQVATWSTDVIPHRKREAETYLDTVKQAWEQLMPQITTCVEVGMPARTIIEQAEKFGCELIVMTTHGRSGIQRWMMGSVAEKVLRFAPCPVLILRDDVALTHFLVTVDGSYLSEMVLEPTFALAGSLGPRVTLLRVEDPQDRPDPAVIEALTAINPSMGEHYNHDFYGQTERYLQNIIDQYDDSPLEIEFDISRGKSAERIVATAKRDGCELIAMATHGRTGLSRWRYGSTTEKVLRLAEHALFVVRPPEEET